MRKPVCTVIVGLPGLGKSSMLSFVDNPEFGDTVFVYSTDRFIEEAAKQFGITYADAFKDNISNAITSMDALLDKAIEERIDVYWDQTNLTVAKRNIIITKMTAAGYDVRCFCILPPEEGHLSDLKVWKYRLDNRPGKVIPSEVLSSMSRSFVVPSCKEGFSRVSLYNLYGYLLADSYAND